MRPARPAEIRVVDEPPVPVLGEYSAAHLAVLPLPVHVQVGLQHQEVLAAVRIVLRLLEQGLQRLRGDRQSPLSAEALEAHPFHALSAASLVVAVSLAFLSDRAAHVPAPALLGLCTRLVWRQSQQTHVLHLLRAGTFPVARCTSRTKHQALCRAHALAVGSALVLVRPSLLMPLLLSGLPGVEPSEDSQASVPFILV